MDYQGKTFEGVLYVAMFLQSTDSLEMQINILELFMQIFNQNEPMKIQHK